MGCLKMFFPDNNSGSRIMITTRLTNVAACFGACGFRMKLLDENNCWNLLCKTVFQQGNCPLDFEDIGKKIAKKCRGLPLSIIVVGGLLANSERTQEYWQYLAAHLHSLLNLEDNDNCFKILSLSYNHLPVHLKPCFLYMGVFPEDSVICASRLMKLWVAEGFLKPIKGESLEMVTRGYLNDLVNRNLILVQELGLSSGKVKTCKIHNLLRNLCVRIVCREKFMSVTMSHGFVLLNDKHSQRRIGINQGTLDKHRNDGQALYTLPLASQARTLICDFYSSFPAITNFRLMRVLQIVPTHTTSSGFIISSKNAEYSFGDVFQLVNSQYLAFNGDWRFCSAIPSSIHFLWNLQILIVKGTPKENYVTAPTEIWGMLQIRHLEIESLFLPNPSVVQIPEEGVLVLTNLHSLSYVKNFGLSEDIVKRIPNIKKLKVSYDGCFEGCYLKNLGCLEKLESLSISFTSQNEVNHQNISLHDFAFPRSLKKLTIRNGSFCWEEMTKIGSLPNLEALKLYGMAFDGRVWNPAEGEFLRLRYLLIAGCPNLRHWTTDNTHFPHLVHLSLHYLFDLEEIPLDIGEIPTLRSISVTFCSKSAYVSAKNIHNMQTELRNSDLRIRVHLFENDIEIVSFASENFEVGVCNIL